MTLGRWGWRRRTEGIGEKRYEVFGVFLFLFSEEKLSIGGSMACGRLCWMCVYGAMLYAGDVNMNVQNRTMYHLSWDNKLYDCTKDSYRS